MIGGTTLRILAPAIAATVLTAQSAAAQSADLLAGRTDLEVVGTTSPACLIQPATAGQGANASFSGSGSGGGSIRITELADPTTAEPRAAAMRVELPVICNSAHTIVIRSRNGGLARAGGTGRLPIGGFAQFLPYRVAASWAGLTGNAPSDQASPLEFDVPNGGRGVLGVSIDVDGGGNPLVAGLYDDTLQIEITASQ